MELSYFFTMTIFTMTIRNIVFHVAVVCVIFVGILFVFFDTLSITIIISSYSVIEVSAQLFK